MLLIIADDFPAHDITAIGKWVIDSIEFSKLEELAVFLVEGSLFFDLLLFFWRHLGDIQLIAKITEVGHIGTGLQRSDPADLIIWHG